VSDEALRCYRCGADLAALTLPLSRRDTCPSCRVDLRVCLMCTSYDPNVAKHCKEDDAEDVVEKARSNFCEFFVPNAAAFSPGRMTAEQRAQAELENLFGRSGDLAATGMTSEDDDGLRDAEALFKS